MGRPRLKTEDKKVKLGITISRELIKKVDEETNNKSAFIERLIIDYFKNKEL